MKTKLFMLLLALGVLAGCASNNNEPAQRTFMQLAADRYSCRNFSDKPVPVELINQVLEAGRLAPTAVNLQPQIIYIIKSEEAMAKLKSAYKGNLYGAPIVLLFVSDENSAWHNTNWENGHDGAIDVSIVATHCMLEAEELGLGTVWCGATNNKDIEQVFGLPENEHSVLLMPIGYKTDDCQPSPMHSSRKPLSEIVKVL